MLRRLAKRAVHRLRNEVDDRQARPDPVAAVADSQPTPGPQPVRVPDPPAAAAPVPEPTAAVPVPAAVPEPEPEPEPEPVLAIAEPAAPVHEPEPAAPVHEPEPEPEPEPDLNLAEPEPDGPKAEIVDAPAPALSGIAAAIANAAAGNAPVKEAPKVSFTSSGGSSVSGRMNDDSASLNDTEIHESEDGTPYWGRLDNESSRAKASGKTLIIDQWECINCGTCVENTDAVFVLPDDCKAVAYRQDGHMDLIQDAIDACPVTCIHWTGEPGQYPQVNDRHGNETS